MAMFKSKDPIKRGRPVISDLIQKTKVTGRVYQKRKSNPVTSAIISKIESECLPRAVQKSGKHVSNVSKFEQQNAIRAVGAVECGNLVSSIQSKEKSSSNRLYMAETSTNISNTYPKYVLRGRPPVYPKKAGALFYSRRCGGNYGLHKASGRVAPRNFMGIAFIQTMMKVPEIVEGECRSAFGKL